MGGLFSVFKKLFAESYPLWPIGFPPPKDAIYDPLGAFMLKKKLEKAIAFQERGSQAPSLISLAELEKKGNFTYCPKLIFRSRWTYFCVKKRCKTMLKKGWISEERLFLGALNLNPLTNGWVLPMTIKWIDEEMGYGGFAKTALEPFTYIGEYGGMCLERGVLFPHSTPYSFVYPIKSLLSYSHSVDARDFGNETRYLNHSDTPNCEAIAVFTEGLFRIMFRTFKKVEKDEELTYHYGDSYWRFRQKKSRN